MSNDTTTPAPKLVTVDQRVGEYISVRDELKKRKEEYEKSIEPLVELQNMLTGWLQRFMEQAGADNIKTANGTCYNSTKYSASLADPEAFMKFVIANQAFELLDRKANVTACRDYTDANNLPPPGVNLSSISTVGVRRASGK